jgi:hypothetical protein
MKGYLRTKPHRQVFKGGWFHSGDGVIHPDGYVQSGPVKDIALSRAEEYLVDRSEERLYSTSRWQRPQWLHGPMRNGARRRAHLSNPTRARHRGRADRLAGRTSPTKVPRHAVLPRYLKPRLKDWCKLRDMAKDV